jgi:acyl-coenzyme A thioesterase PaaI-like protein
VARSRLVRALADLVATGALGDDDWDRLSAVAAPLVERHDRSAPSTYARAVADDVADDVTGGPARDEGSAPTHPLAVGAAAVFPEIAFTRESDRLVADMCFGPAFEGPPALVHGGHLASAFDIVLSAAAALTSPYTVTRRLEVRFLRPTPLGEPLRLVAVVGRRDARLLEVGGRMLVGGRVTAKGRAQCVEFPPERYAARFGDPTGRAGATADSA